MCGRWQRNGYIVTMPDQTTTTDQQLLSSFIDQSDEPAFEELIRRHQVLVQAVCRRVLGAKVDIADEVQAVFLTLATKARRLRHHPTLAGWLHRVAWFIARRSQQARLTRQRVEREATQVEVGAHAASESAYLPVLDRALEALPEKYRTVLILHHFEGHSRSDIAKILKTGDSAVSMRLTRGHELLRKRLARHSSTLSLASLGILLGSPSAEAAVVIDSAAFAHTASLVAIGNGTAIAAGSKAMTLSQAALKAMLAVQLKAAAAIACMIIGAGSVSVISHRSWSSEAEHSEIVPDIDREAARKLLAQAVHDYRKGNFVEAGASLNSSLGCRDDEVFYAFIAALGMEGAGPMLENPLLLDPMIAVGGRAKQYEQALSMQPRYIRHLKKMMREGSEQERLAAKRALLGFKNAVTAEAQPPAMVRFLVTDLDKARAFYVDLLGFSPGKDSIDGMLLVEASPQTTLLLYLADSIVPMEYGGKVSGAVPIIFVDDIDRQRHEWMDKGVTFAKAPFAKFGEDMGESPFGRFVAVRDPFGNFFEIMQRKTP
jgi:RNA polymerase sigma factor (sigma-70 family)